MGKMSLKMWLKISIAQIAWKLFIWGSNTTEEIYWELIYNIEREKKLSKQDGNCNKPAVLAPVFSQEEIEKYYVRCEFDDTCDVCDDPQHGSYAAGYTNDECGCEVNYYICGKCASLAIPKHIEEEKRLDEQLTIKKARSHRFWLGGVMCRLFHHIRTIEECKFIDRVDGREVGQYECCRCNKRFMANSKRSWFRVYN